MLITSLWTYTTSEMGSIAALAAVLVILILAMIVEIAAIAMTVWTLIKNLDEFDFEDKFLGPNVGRCFKKFPGKTKPG